MENMGNSSARPDGKSVRVKKATPISVRLFRGIAITIVSIVGFISVFVGMQLYKKSIVLFDELVEQQFSYMGKNINHFMQDARNVTGILAESPVLQNADETLYNYIDESKGIEQTHNGKAETEITSLLERTNRHHPEFQVAYMATKWGGIAIAPKQTKVQSGFDPRTRQWYKDAMASNGKIIMTQAYESHDGDLIVTIAKSIKNSKNEYIGCMGIDIKLTDLTSFISSINIGKTGYCMLLQGDDTILADPKHPKYNFKNSLWSTY